MKRIHKEKMADKMRRKPTKAEKALQIALMNLPFEERPIFEAQKIIRGFIADLVIPEARLIVEVDGYSHRKTKRRDARRTAVLESAGYQVIRFWNSEVLGDPTGCVRRITWRLSLPGLMDEAY